MVIYSTAAYYYIVYAFKDTSFFIVFQCLNHLQRNECCEMDMQISFGECLQRVRRRLNGNEIKLAFNASHHHHFSCYVVQWHT